MGEEGKKFSAVIALLGAIAAVLEAVQSNIGTRGDVYSRAAFYEDVAAGIRAVLALRLYPFSASEYNWAWWAEQLERQAARLGSDAQYAARLGEFSAPPEVRLNQIRNFVALFYGMMAQEAEDRDRTDFGDITPAECAKLTHRIARFILPTILKGTPPWLATVQRELQAVYRSMGEPDKAGSAWVVAPGQPNPPVSFPEP